MICPRCWKALIDPDTKDRCTLCGGDGEIPDQPLSEHFLLSELIHSDTAIRQHIPNAPSEEQVANLRQLAVTLLEPVRARFGPLHINSGLRLPALNIAIGGTAHSAHMDGHAADFVPADKNITLKEIVDWIVANPHTVPYDQVIYEGTWVHLGALSPSRTVRRQELMMFGGKYTPYDPSDKRVR